MDHIVASWKFNEPVIRTYVYPNNTETFYQITGVSAFKTGCHCLREVGNKRVIIVPPGWRYIVQERS
mgnify:CR=1 FL=1